MNKVKAFTAANVFELEVILNAFNETHDVFATQVFYVPESDRITTYWSAIVYYKYFEVKNGN